VAVVVQVPQDLLTQQQLPAQVVQVVVVQVRMAQPMQALELLILVQAVAQVDIMVQQEFMESLVTAVLV
jgi:hypothetical protein